MPSPFPGMNPYLEQADAWQDFHQRFITHAAAVIGAQVRPAYIVKIDEHVYLREPTADDRMLIGRGKVTVARPREATTGGQSVPTTAPAYARLPVDVERQSFVEVRAGRPSAGCGHRAPEPGEQEAGSRPRAVPGQAASAPGEQRAPHRDRPAPRRAPPAAGGPAGLRLLRDRQPRRRAAARGRVAGPPARPAAGRPGPAAPP